jgi:NADPH2:quinone reductase
MGSGLDGAFAEQTAVPASGLRPTPPDLDDISAAAFGVTYRTAYHSLITIGAAQPGDTVVVLGAAGGVGLATVDIAVALGMRVIAAASSPERVALTLARGAAAGIDYTAEDLKQRIKDLTDGRGADVIVDPVGGPYAEAALRASRWGARFVCVGFASGEIPRIPLNLVLLKGVVVRGFELRTLPHNLPEAMAAGERHLAELVAGGLRPHVSSVHRLTDVVAALGEVAERRALGKVVVTP